jgi:hypothetical protein
MEARARLVANGRTLEVNSDSLLSGCQLFAQDPVLMQTPYAVRSQVSHSDVQDFLSLIEGRHVVITPRNVSGLWLLSEEFGHARLLNAFQELRNSIDTNPDSPLEHPLLLRILNKKIFGMIWKMAQFARFLRFLSLLTSSNLRSISSDVTRIF